MNRFSIVIDKGTWDAISLGGSSDLLKNYRHSILESFSNSLSSNRYFIIFSCNYTRDELIEQFTSNDESIHHKCSAFRYFNDITPKSNSTFTYGGQSGVTATGIVFSL